MCCGQDEGPLVAAVTTEEPMVKVYTAVPGAVLNIGTHGMASNEQAAEVPESVAAELLGRSDLVIVRPGDYVLPPAVSAEAGDFVIPEDGAAVSAENAPAAPAKSATRARKE